MRTALSLLPPRPCNRLPRMKALATVLDQTSGYLRRGAASGAPRGRPSKRRREPSGVDDADWDSRDSDPPGRKSQSSRSVGALSGSSQPGASRGRGIARAAQAGRPDGGRQDPPATDVTLSNDGGGRAADADGGEGAGHAASDRYGADSRADGQPSSSPSSSDNDSDMHDDDWDHD